MEIGSVTTFNPCPKAETRKAENDRRKAKLREYRRQQYLIAIESDGGMCRKCGRVAVDVHHVFGRGRDSNDCREHHDNLECVCRGCHPHGHE